MVPHPTARQSPARPGRCRSVRELRHLRRCLPVVDAVSQRRRAGHRHRHAAGADRRSCASACSARWPRWTRWPFAWSSSAATTARRSTALAAPDVAVFSLMCTGQLPPSFVEYALRDGAAGVLVSGCRGRRLRVPPRATLDRRSSGGAPRAAPARACAARAVCAGVGRPRRGGPGEFRAAAPAPTHQPRHRRAGLPERARAWMTPTPSARSAGSASCCCTALFALVIGVFSRWPAYQHLASDQALIKLSFNHQGKPVADCRRLSAEELAKLPPNMRAPMDCPRERSPITVELDVDGSPALRHVARPTGLSRDGASAVYHRMQVAGRHAPAGRAPEGRRARQRLRLHARGHRHAEAGADPGDRLRPRKRRDHAAMSTLITPLRRAARAGDALSFAAATAYGLAVPPGLQRGWRAAGCGSGCWR